MCMTDSTLCAAREAPGQRPTTDLSSAVAHLQVAESHAAGVRTPPRSHCWQEQGEGGVMGKGSRVRAGRQVDRRGRPAPSPGAAFGIGVVPLASTGPEAPDAARDDVVGGVREYEAAWRAAARVTEALARLRELAVARAEARRVVDGLEEEVEVAVAHLRVDGQLGAGRAGVGDQSAGCPSALRRCERCPRDPPGPASSTRVRAVTHVFPDSAYL